MATRTSSKTVATAFGISLCVMFLSGSFALLSGLEETTTRVADRFDEGPVIAYSGLPLENSCIDASILDNMRDHYATANIVPVTLLYGQTLLIETFAVVVHNFSFLGLDLYGLNDGEVWLSWTYVASLKEDNVTLNPGATLELISLSSRLNLTFERYQPELFFPDRWLLINENSSLLLNPSSAGGASLVVVEEDSTDIKYLMDKGLHVLPTIAGVDFFRKGIYGLEPALWGLAFASGAVIVVLTFTLAAIEVRSREADFRVLRQIGATRPFLVGLVLLQSIYVSVIGALIGIAFGSALTNAVISFVPLLGMSTFVLPTPTLAGLCVPFCTSILAGLAGGLIPARSVAMAHFPGVKSRS